MGIKIVAIGIIIISGIIGANFIIQNSLIKNVNLSDVSLDTGDVSGEKSQENLKIENPIKWVDNPKNISEAISEIKKAGSEIGKAVKDLKQQIGNIAQEKESTTSTLKTVTSSQLIATSSQAVNINNIDYLISEMKKAGAKQNMSDEKLLAAEKAIREIAATSTDLMAEFYKSVNVKNAKIGGLEGFFEKILSVFDFIETSKAESFPSFGGAVVSAVPCTCSPSVWLLGITPLAPTYATVLSYISGTQIYSNYVPTPHTGQYFLGFYAPTSASLSCWMTADPCTFMPDWGLIMPIVGSTL